MGIGSYTAYSSRGASKKKLGRVVRRTFIIAAQVAAAAAAVSAAHIAYETMNGARRWVGGGVGLALVKVVVEVMKALS